MTNDWICTFENSSFMRSGKKMQSILSIDFRPLNGVQCHAMHDLEDCLYIQQQQQHQK